MSSASCQEQAPVPAKVSQQQISSYWSSGAELTSYDLKQERYGEIHEGEAVTIYVREPFLKNKQVKDESGKGNYQVLKMNSTRKFVTGIYPYSTMVSVFHPFDEPQAGNALKTTTSVQEWCGHIFMQTNRRSGTLKTMIKSYFENEDEGSFTHKASVYLEDEIWTAIRLNPAELPTGKIEMIPSSLSDRFAHTNPKSQNVTAMWSKGDSKETSKYSLNYNESGRKLTIEIDIHPPFTIQSWTETENEKLLSSGKIKKQLRNFPYWNYHFKKDQKAWRAKLGLKD